MTDIKEIQLIDEFGDLAVLRFIKKVFPDMDASVHYDDYDDYGCSHYILIRGECADIQLKKDYGGMYCPGGSLECSVIPHQVRDETSFLTHSFYFKDKEPDKENIASYYANRIKGYIEKNIKYLNGDPSLYYRVDTRKYDDLSGVHKQIVGKNSYSYDIVYVPDEYFYTDKELNLEIVSYKPDIDEEVTKERYIFNTVFGHFLIEEKEDKFKWRAEFLSKEPYPACCEGKTVKEAYEKLFEKLSNIAKRAGWYNTIINPGGKKMYGVIHDMNKPENDIYGPGIKKQILLIGWGETKREAACQAHYGRWGTSGEFSSTLELMSDADVIGGFDVYPLSDIAIEYFSMVCSNNVSTSVIIKENEVLEKESLANEGQPMTAEEWSQLRAIMDD